MKHSCLAVVLFCASASAALAQSNGGRHAAILLELPTSARALGVGNAGTALADDAMSLFSNPAQLAVWRRTAVAASAERYISSSTLAAVAASTPLGPGVAAIGVQELDYGSAPEIVPDENFGGERGIATGATVSAYDMAATLGYAVSRGRVRAGAAVEGVRQEIAGESGSAIAGDVGVAATLGHGIVVGLAGQHLGGSLTLATSTGTLPRTLRGGVSVPVLTTNTMALGLLAEADKVEGVPVVPMGGAEFSWRVTSGLSLVGRAGGRRPPEGSDASPVTFGGSIVGHRFALDYAYESFDTFGGMHRIGIRWIRD